jgi:Caspase domain
MLARVIVAIVLLLLPTAGFAQAEKRIALLIGNQGYGNEIGRLANPLKDVALLEKSLKGLNFEVTTVGDAGLAGLYQAVNAYARRVQAAGPNAVGFFYYSGHGAADAGTNYLIPVDVKTTETGELWDQSLRLSEITRKLKTEAGNATHFVVFDACRNTLRLTRAGSRALVQSKGFVPVTQESGMLIAYATAEGELASDVGDGAGPYAKVLAEEISKPGVEAVTMFRRVQVRVRSSIGQEPWLGFSALGEVHFGGAALAKEGTRDVAPHSDQWWQITRLGQGCAVETYNFDVKIRQGVIEGYAGGGAISGSIASDGTIAFSHPPLGGGTSIRYSGRIDGNSGSGTFRMDSACFGTFTVNPSAAPAAPKCTGEKTYDGEWMVDGTGAQGCVLKRWQHVIVIKDGKILVPKLSPGKIDAAGNFQYRHLSYTGQEAGTYTGNLSFASCTGSGKYDYSGFCKGTLKLTKR